MSEMERDVNDDDNKNDDNIDDTAGGMLMGGIDTCDGYIEADVAERTDVVDNGGDGLESQTCVLPSDFLQFQIWLQSPDGGKKCEKSAKQHSFQVGVILDAIDSDRNVSSLWNSKLLMKFYTHATSDKKFLPATTKSYFNSLRHWFSYILSEESDRISVEVRQQIQHTRERVARWITSIRKESSARSLEKMDSDIPKLVTPDMVAVFDRSEFATGAVKLLGTLMEQPGSQLGVSMTEYVDIRDFILTQIIIGNANRSGVLANLTLEQFNSAQFVDGHYVMSVVDHKTAFMYGPAKVILTPILYSWISVFVKYARCQITQRSTGDAKYLFLSWTGQKLDSGQISRAIQSAWKKAGLGGEISCTLMRKSAVSFIHQKCPEQKSNLADLMCHSTQTATKSYRLVKRQQTSVAASTVLNEMMKTSCSTNTLDERSDQCPSDRLLSESNKSVDESEATLEIPQNSIADSHMSSVITDGGKSKSAVSKPSEGDSDDESIFGPSVASTKSLFSNTDVQAIQESCKEIIKSGPISQRRIAESLLRFPETASVMTKYTIAQIITRIKYERRKSRLSVPKYFAKTG